MNYTMGFGGPRTGGVSLHYFARPKAADPFLTPGEINLPKDIKSLFRLAERFYYNDPLMSKIIRAQAHYPITDIIIDETDDDIKAKWTYILDDVLDLRNHLLNIGLDFYTYGNAFVAMFPPISRQAKCTSCNNVTDIQNIKKVAVKLNKNPLRPNEPVKSFHLTGICPICRVKRKFEPIETVSNDIEEARITRLSPMNIDIKYNPVTGKSIYYYIPTRNELSQIKAGDPDYLSSVHKEFIITALRGGRIKLNNNFIYHFKAPTISGTDSRYTPAWGKPFYMSIMKLLYIIQQFWKTNEFIAWEHTVPIRVIYPPQGQADQAPPAGMKGFMSKIDAGIRQWSRDKGAILISDTPIGYQRIGGEGRAFFLVNEIREAQEQVLMAIDFPRDLLFGGTWSGQFAAMRMLENSYSNYIRDIKRFLRFVVKRISEMYDIAPVDVGIKEFKRMDDVAFISQIGQLAAAGVVSKKYYFDLLGIDYNKEMHQIEQEQIDSINSQTEVMKVKSKAMAEAKNEYIKTLLKQAMELAAQESGFDMENPHVDFETVIDKLVSQIMQLDDQQKSIALQQIAQKSQMLYQLIMIKIQALQQFVAAQEQAMQGEEEQAVQEAAVPEEPVNEEQEVNSGSAPPPQATAPRRKQIATGG